jgi:hypothetical protein
VLIPKRADRQRSPPTQSKAVVKENKHGSQQLRNPGQTARQHPGQWDDPELINKHVMHLQESGISM